MALGQVLDRSLADGSITEKKTQGLQNSWKRRGQKKECMVCSINQSMMDSGSRANKKRELAPNSYKESKMQRKTAEAEKKTGVAQ